MGQSFDDLINSVTTDNTNVAADDKAVADAQAKDSADKIQLTGDQTSLANALVAYGAPIAKVAADNKSVTIFAASGSPPTVSTQTITLAGSVPVPGAAPA